MDKPEIVSLHVTADGPGENRSPIEQAGELTLCCIHLQKNGEVVVAINPNLTEFTPDKVTMTSDQESGPFRFKIFDIHQKQTQSVRIDGVDYEIEFLTWAKPDPETLRFDFEVRKIGGKS